MKNGLIFLAIWGVCSFVNFAYIMPKKPTPYGIVLGAVVIAPVVTVISLFVASSSCAMYCGHEN